LYATPKYLTWFMPSKGYTSMHAILIIKVKNYHGSNNCNTIHHEGLESSVFLRGCKGIILRAPVKKIYHCILFNSRVSDHSLSFFSNVYAHHIYGCLSKAFIVYDIYIYISIIQVLNGTSQHLRLSQYNLQYHLHTRHGGPRGVQDSNQMSKKKNSHFIKRFLSEMPSTLFVFITMEEDSALSN
jgi:hypothetical protein